MRNTRIPLTIFSILIMALAAGTVLSGCNKEEKPTSDSGVTKVSAQVETGQDGMTTEQRNVRRRVEEDNKPGATKHLYVISAFSGDVILYSTVKGKVTSSGKRLTARLRAGVGFQSGQWYNPERIQDDGTYGSSDPYVYWWDARDNYHQHYVTGGQVIHVSSVPMAFPKIILNLEETAESDR